MCDWSKLTWLLSGQNRRPESPDSEARDLSNVACLALWPWVVTNFLCAAFFSFTVWSEVNSDNSRVLSEAQWDAGLKRIFCSQMILFAPFKVTWFFFYQIEWCSFFLIIKHKCSTTIKVWKLCGSRRDFISKAWLLVKAIKITHDRTPIEDLGWPHCVSMAGFSTCHNGVISWVYIACVCVLLHIWNRLWEHVMMSKTNVISYCCRFQRPYR